MAQCVSVLSEDPINRLVLWQREGFDPNAKALGQPSPRNYTIERLGKPVHDIYPGTYDYLLAEDVRRLADMVGVLRRLLLDLNRFNDLTADSSRLIAVAMEARSSDDLLPLVQEAERMNDRVQTTTERQAQERLGAMGE